MSPTSTTAATAISTNRSFGTGSPSTIVVSIIQPGTSGGFVSGPKMPTIESPERERKPDGDEDLLDGASVERADEHELDRGADDSADEERERRSREETVPPPSPTAGRRPTTPSTRRS